MKKILIAIGIIFWLLWSFNYSYSSSDDFNIKAKFDEEMQKTKTLVKKEQDMRIDTWFKNVIFNWVTNISWILWLFAIAMIAYGWLMMTISTWDDEKIKKAKDIVKWWILWFLALVSAWSIIAIVINIVFTLWW